MKKPKKFERKNGKYQHEVEIVLSDYPDQIIDKIIIEYHIILDPHLNNWGGALDEFLLHRFLDRALGKNNYQYRIEFFRRDSEPFPFIEKIFIKDINTFNIVRLKITRLKKLSKLRVKKRI